MQSFKEFKEEVLNEVQKCPKKWRKGQAVFNVVDAQYGIARAVQFVQGVDCFYVDDNIDDFLKAAYDIYKKVREKA